MSLPLMGRELLILGFQYFYQHQIFMSILIHEYLMKIKSPIATALELMVIGGIMDYL
jgi:hypothetical protein